MLLKASLPLFVASAFAQSDRYYGDTGLEYSVNSGIANHASAGLCKNRQFVSANATIDTCKAAYGLECLHDEMVFKIYKAYLEDLRGLSTGEVQFNSVVTGDGYTTENCADGLSMTEETDDDGDEFFRYSFLLDDTAR